MLARQPHAALDLLPCNWLAARMLRRKLAVLLRPRQRIILALIHPLSRIAT